MAFSLTFDATKFSEALSPPGAAKIEWTHTEADLQVVLEGSNRGMSNAMLRLDIFEGTNLLERVELVQYINASNRLRDAKERAGTSLRIEELPVFGITKDPVLALRYQLDGKARRFQLRLAFSKDCQELVSILSQRGIAFSQQRPNTARPTTSTSRPSTTQHDDRPLNSRNSHTSQQEQGSSRPRPSPFHIPDMEAGSLSQRRVASTAPRTNRVGQLVAPARELTRDESLAPRQILPSRPSSGQLWRSQTSQSLRPDVYDVQQVDANANETLSQSNAGVATAVSGADEGFHFPAGGSEVDCEGFKVPPQRGWSSGGVRSHNSALSSDPVEPRPSTALSVTSATSVFPDTLEHEIPPQRMLPFKTANDLRPTSAISIPSAAPFNATDTLEHEIPPRRELPFKTPVSRGGSGTSRPGSAIAPPPSKKAKPSKERPQTANSALKRPSGTPISRDASVPAKTLRVPVQTSLAFLPTKPAPLEGEDVADKPSSMQELIYGGGRHINARARVNSTMDAPHEIETPPGSAERQNRSPIPQGTRFGALATAVPAVSGRISGRYDAAASQDDRSNELSLDQYTSQTPEARQTALDQFMIDNLQNPSFTTLCEDIEQCWRRIALGL